MTRALSLCALFALLTPSCVTPEQAAAARQGLAVLDQAAQVYGKFKAIENQSVQPATAHVQEPFVAVPIPAPAPAAIAPQTLPGLPGIVIR